MVFRGLGFEELNALLAQGHGHLHPFLPKGQFFGWGEKVLNDLGLDGLIGVFDFSSGITPAGAGMSLR